MENKLVRTAQFRRVYMEIAKQVATLSYCSKRQVGAVLVKGPNIVGYGFNGTVSGMPNVCEDDGGEGRDVHAEMNAIIKAGWNSRGADMYITLYPCEHCARHMAQAGVRAVYYLEDHNNEGQVERYGMAAIKMEAGDGQR
jgi:dCMP deaminase